MQGRWEMSKLRITKNDYIETITPPGIFVPQLNLFYDEETDTYYNKFGKVVNVNMPVQEPMETLNPKKSALPLEVVLQVLALVLAAAAQYNVLENNITESENKLAVYRATTDEKFNNISQLYRDIDALKQKQEDLLRELDELKYHSKR